MFDTFICPIFGLIGSFIDVECLIASKSQDKLKYSINHSKFYIILEKLMLINLNKEVLTFKNYWM